MIGNITIRQRGVIARDLRRGFRKHSKTAWHDAGKFFHLNLRDKRFSIKHAREAGYQKRGGEELGLTTKEFFRSYTGRKLKKYHHRRPLELTGETRRLIRTATITATGRSADGKGGGVRVGYAGARKFNYRRNQFAPKMADEFRRLLPDEIREEVDVYDTTLDRELKSDNTTSTKDV